MPAKAAKKKNSMQKSPKKVTSPNKKMKRKHFEAENFEMDEDENESDVSESSVSENNFQSSFQIEKEEQLSSGEEEIEDSEGNNSENEGDGEGGDSVNEEDDDDQEASEESESEATSKKISKKDLQLKAKKRRAEKKKQKREKKKAILEETRKLYTDDERTIFVGNLPKESTKKSLFQLFDKYGKIATARFRSAPVADERVSKKVATIKKEFHPDRTNINAYIAFYTPQEAHKALAANGEVVDGRHLTVTMVKNSVDRSKAVFLGNLPFNADEEQLHELFKSCGKIFTVRVVRDKVSGVGKGIGYVNFESADAVELALLKNGAMLEKRALRVTRCLNTEKKEDNNKDTNKIHSSNKGQSSQSVMKIAKKEKKKAAASGPFEGQKVAEGKIKKKNKKQKLNPKKKAAVETLVKSMSSIKGKLKQKF